MFNLNLRKNIKDVVTGFRAGIGLFYYEFLNNVQIVTLENLTRDEYREVVKGTNITNKDLMTVLDYEAMK